MTDAEIGALKQKAFDEGCFETNDVCKLGARS